MPEYANLTAKSGVRWYDESADAITVTFDDGRVYRYDASNPGLAVVDRMRVLAASGRGLNGYISRTVRDRYAARPA